MLDWTINAGGLVTAAGRFTGDVAIETNGAFTFDQESDAAYAGILFGEGGFAKNGAGVLALTGDSSGFGGHTDVAAGKLIVGLDGEGSLGGTIDVLSGATLAGTGTVGTTVLASGATIAPGNSIGTLTVDGDITFAAGSTYEAEINPALGNDLIDASGAATINGGTVYALKAIGAYTSGSRWTIIGADGGVSGTFDALDQNMPFVDLALAYDDNNVYIDAARNDVAFCDVAGTFNQCAAGEGLESTGVGGVVYDAIAALPDDEAARFAFDALSGEIYASAQTALIEDSRFVRNAANNRIRAAFGDAGASVAPVLAYRPGDTTMAVAADHAGPVFWFSGFGSWGSTESDGNAASLDRSTGGPADRGRQSGR